MYRHQNRGQEAERVLAVLALLSCADCGLEVGGEF
jgi:hypothetical protein